jgi:hypothetical protein
VLPLKSCIGIGTNPGIAFEPSPLPLGSIDLMNKVCAVRIQITKSNRTEKSCLFTIEHGYEHCRGS